MSSASVPVDLIGRRECRALKFVELEGNELDLALARFAVAAQAVAKAERLSKLSTHFFELDGLHRPVAVDQSHYFAATSQGE